MTNLEEIINNIEAAVKSYQLLELIYTNEQSEALRKSRLGASGDLSSMPIHMADIGSDNYEQEFTLDLLDSERKMLVKIYEAMLRIQDGTYGICDGTGEQIARARLEAKPWAKYGIKYAQMLENGEVFEDEYSDKD